MQLVRNLYTGERERTLKRKIREAKLAEDLENRHPGREGKLWILTKYLNSVPYGTVGGQTGVGIQAAARIFFDKPAAELKLREAALLAGLPQAPSQYNPFLNPTARSARATTSSARWPTRATSSRRPPSAPRRMGLGVKRNRYYTARRESYFFDYVKQELIDRYGLETVRRGGLRIDTTLDLRKQRLARKAMDGQLGAPDRSAAIVTIDPRTGYIKAMASSSRYGDSKFNLAAQGHRQPGSTFKVMVLMTALRRGVGPRRARRTPPSRCARAGCRPRPTTRSRPTPTTTAAAWTWSGDAALRQHRLRPARRRPRPRGGQADRAGHGHQDQARRLPGRGPGRPAHRRLAARDGQRLRDDRLGRLALPADRDHARSRSPTGASRTWASRAGTRPSTTA